MDTSITSLYSSTEDELISDLACECCCLKILTVSKQNDKLKRKLLQAETQQEISNLDLKEKDEEIYNLLEQNEEMKLLNLKIVSRISYYEERLRVTEISNQNKDQFYLKEKRMILNDSTKVECPKKDNEESKPDIMILLENQIKDMKTEIDHLSKREIIIKQELISVKDEAGNALNEFMDLKRQYEELKMKNESVERSGQQLKDLTNLQNIRIYSLEKELTDLRGKDLQSRSKLSQSHIDNVKLKNELFLSQSDRDDKRRQLEIRDNSFRKSNEHIIELQTQISKLKLLLSNKENENKTSSNDQIIKFDRINLTPASYENRSQLFERSSVNNINKIDFLNSHIKTLEEEKLLLKRKGDEETNSKNDYKIKNDDLNDQIHRMKDEMRILKIQHDTLKEDNKQLQSSCNSYATTFQERSAKLNELIISKLNLEAEISKGHLKIEELNRLINYQENTIKELERKLHNDFTKDDNHQRDNLEEKEQPKHILIKVPQRRVRFVNSNDFKSRPTVKECPNIEELFQIMKEIKDINELKKSTTSKCSCQTANVMQDLDSLVQRQQSLLQSMHAILLKERS